jgi:hypothetical protein
LDILDFVANQRLIVVTGAYVPALKGQRGGDQ